MKTQLDSINLFARNAAVLRDFYVSVFGLAEDLDRSHPPGFFMIQGGRGTNILIQEAGLVHGEPGGKGFELGLEVDSMAGVQEAVLAANGTIVNDTQQMDWGMAITIADPEGHSVNVYSFKGR